MESPKPGSDFHPHRGLGNWFTLTKMSKRLIARRWTSMIYHSGKPPNPGPDGVRKTQEEDYLYNLLFTITRVIPAHAKSSNVTARVMWDTIMCSLGPVSHSLWAHGWPSSPSLACSPVWPRGMFQLMGTSRSEMYHFQAWPQENFYRPSFWDTPHGKWQASGWNQNSGSLLGEERHTGQDACFCAHQAALAICYTS